MAIDPQRLLALEFPDLEFTWTERDCMLYALATGFGQDPLDEHELPFLIGGASLRVSPTFAITLYYDDRWMHASGVNLAMSLHGEQRNVFHRAIAPSGRVRVSSRIVGLFDKGPGRGLIVECEQLLRDAASGEPIATNVISNFARADGGIGFSSGPAPKPHVLPDRAADWILDRATRPEQALIYRLCGDRNPLHADPATARAAGFPRPILHGMCTYGCATRAILAAACDLRPHAPEKHRRAHQRSGLSRRRAADRDLAGRRKGLVQDDGPREGRPGRAQQRHRDARLLGCPTSFSRAMSIVSILARRWGNALRTSASPAWKPATSAGLPTRDAAGLTAGASGWPARKASILATISAAPRRVSA